MNTNKTALYSFCISILFVSATLESKLFAQAPSPAIVKNHLQGDLEPATFIGGDDSLNKFLEDNLDYPDSAIINNHMGICLIGFIIREDASMDSIIIVKSSGYAYLDEEALRVVKLTAGHWIPAKSNRKPTKSICRFPIVFEIDNDE